MKTFVTKEKKNRAKATETSFIFTRLVLSVTLPRNTQPEVRGKYAAYLKNLSGP